MDKNRRLMWQIYPSYVVVIIISLLAVSWYMLSTIEDFILKQIVSDLHTRGQLIQDQLAVYLQPLDPDKLDRFCKDTGGKISTRITVVLPEGKVIGDSEEDPALMENHKNRPEILAALKGQPGSSMRFSATLNQKMMYAALPLTIKNEIYAIVRLSIPVTDIDIIIDTLYKRVILSGIVIAILTSVISFFISRRISKPIEEMRRVAEKFSQGELKHRLHPPNNFELAGLAKALNVMATQLEDRIETVIRQRNEYEAVLSSMSEGVIAINNEEYILNINQSGRNMFKLNPSDIKGKSIQEILRNRDFHQFVSSAVSDEQPKEGDFVIHQNTPRIVSTRSAPLYAPGGDRIGSLLVFNDVTRIRHLENVRKDFVANISHEIKTPLTAIQGFIETLSQNPDLNREETRRCIEIIERHVIRLNSIVDDLLSLARIEQEDGNKEFRLQQTPIKDVIEAALPIVQPNAKDKGITFSIACEESVSARIDASLLELALVNLMDNAVKYSPEKSKIDIIAGEKDRNIYIKIRDNGPGIPKEHLPRIFERFYRVDEARSRKLGGTGLGLAIVKHIVKVHNGTVVVESALGKGSTFTINLPDN